jgi:hypothetical protein
MKFRHSAFFGNLVSGILTGNVRWELPGRSGTLALKSDIDSAIGLNEAWVTASLVNGFTNFGNGYQGVRYRLRNKTVELQGICTKSTGNAVETEIFSLPVGMRPNLRIILPSAGNLPGTADNIRLDVLPDGKVVVNGPAANGVVLAVMLSCTFSL